MAHGRGDGLTHPSGRDPREAAGAAQAGSDRNLLRTVVVPHGATPATCPVQALRALLEASDTRFGPVFRKIDSWGAIEPRSLGVDALRWIFVRRTPRRGKHHPAPRTRHPAYRRWGRRQQELAATGTHPEWLVRRRSVRRLP